MVAGSDGSSGVIVIVILIVLFLLCCFAWWGRSAWARPVRPVAGVGRARPGRAGSPQEELMIEHMHLICSVFGSRRSDRRGA